MLESNPSSVASSSKSGKRPTGSKDSDAIMPAQKIAKGAIELSDGLMTFKAFEVHPLFSKSGQGTFSPSFNWIKPSLGPKKSCLHGINLKPSSSSKVAAFDLDGTLIKSNHYYTVKQKANLFWEWWKPCVPSRLKEVHTAGFSVVLISNQALRTDQDVEQWKRKISVIAAALPEVPFRIFAALEKDGYRKPLPGMWYELTRIFCEHKVRIEKTASFFVGDAAGRSGDWASTDRKWAINVEIPFFTPEEYFLNQTPQPFTLPGFHVSSLPDLPRVTPTSSPLLPPLSRCRKPEIIVFVGYPCLGKTSFFVHHFEPAGYVHINQDKLRTRQKCVQAAEQALDVGQSCVIDNTNRDAQTRRYYVDLAKNKGFPVRCFLFDGSPELAWHNNLYRAYVQPLKARSHEHDFIPSFTFDNFKANYEPPLQSEGFSEMRTVNWIFEGSEDERRRWSMWLHLNANNKY